MKSTVFCLLLLIAACSAFPQGIHSAIIDVINSAVPAVAINPVPIGQPSPFAAVNRPVAAAPGGISAFAAAQHAQSPSGATLINAQTSTSQGR